MSNTQLERDELLAFPHYPSLRLPAEKNRDSPDSPLFAPPRFAPARESSARKA